jgi:hypothetical protein
MHGLTDHFEHGALGGGHPLSAGGGTCVLSCSNNRKPVVFNGNYNELRSLVSKIKYYHLIIILPESSNVIIL